jgi:hypothetical protein
MKQGSTRSWTPHLRRADHDTEKQDAALLHFRATQKETTLNLIQGGRDDKAELETKNIQD